MSKTRVEAFSDGVLAIIITIMVLELKAPHGWQPDAAPVTAAGILEFLSFVYIGIYWNNPHHLLHVARQVSGGVLRANLHLLFWPDRRIEHAMVERDPSMYRRKYIKPHQE